MEANYSIVVGELTHTPSLKHQQQQIILGFKLINMRVISVISSLIICIAGCTGQHKKNLVIVNPYLKTFSDNNVEKVFITSSIEPEDSSIMTFDKSGNLISDYRFMSRIDYEYDQNGNLVKYHERGENPQRYLITYEYFENKIVQTARPFQNTDDAIGNKSEADNRITFVHTYKFNKHGQIIEVLINFDETEIYNYDIRNRLIKIETYAKDDTSTPKGILEISYWDNSSIIREMKNQWNGQQLWIHYFSKQGLVDSTMEKGVTHNYTYSFYK
ncbi:MAG: hypothetical protein KF845_03445 [Cyclobacteriaceae bacterium]|nr:hypothetical protein [Cyclobacteriaceae bacterium]